MTEHARAKLFMHGRSQAVRLPKEFRMPGTEVEISREGQAVVLKPITKCKVDWEKVFAELDQLRDVDLHIGRSNLKEPRRVRFDD